MLWSTLFSPTEAYRNACVKPGLFRSCLVRAPPQARVVRSGAPCSSPPPRAEWLCPGSPPPDHVCSRQRFAQLGRRFVPAAAFLACGLEVGAGLVGPLFAPGSARLPARLQAHGFSGQKAEGRGGGGRGGGETGEAGGRPEGSGGRDRRDRALVRGLEKPGEAGQGVAGQGPSL